jgi:hypothetical protein
MNFQKNAIIGATKLCGRTTQCLCACNCDHDNHKPIGIKPLVEGSACPLARYNIKPEENMPSWWEAPIDYFEPTDDELFALCALCENAEVVESGDYMTAEPKDWILCMDCPVHGFVESREEQRAEAACC